MAKKAPQAKNPNRVLAGRLNRQKRKGLTPEGRERLRQAALKNQPWRHNTGPTTPEGKARSAKNGKLRQLGRQSVREIRADLADLRSLVLDMRATRKMANQALSGEVG